MESFAPWAPVLSTCIQSIMCYTNRVHAPLWALTDQGLVGIRTRLRREHDLRPIRVLDPLGARGQCGRVHRGGIVAGWFLIPTLEDSRKTVFIEKRNCEDRKIG